jgi:putative addiction module component (TIGR02574 family)
MTKDQVKEILDRVLTWPADRQEDVARMVELMEEQDGSELRLSDQQADEVHRRLADPRDDNIPAEEVFARLRPPE